MTLPFNITLFPIQLLHHDLNSFAAECDTIFINRLNTFAYHFCIVPLVVDLLYFDFDGKPANCTGSYAVIKMKYDERSRRIQEEYFGKNKERVLSTDGYAVVQLVYNDTGNIVQTTCYDTQRNRIG